MKNETIKIPDIGGAEGVEVIEVCVAPGDTVQPEDSLVVLESDKASMEVPAPKGGKVVEVKLQEGDSVSQGDDVLVLEVAEEGAEEEAESPSQESEEPEESETEPSTSPQPAESEAEPEGEATVETVHVPDIGGSEASVIEIPISEGDQVSEGDSLIVLESDKASMEVPSPKSGKVVSLKISEGDQVKEGTPILEMEVAAEKPAPPATEQPGPESETERAAPEPESKKPESDEAAVGKGEQPAAREAPDSDVTPADIASGEIVYAGPAVRKLAREFGIDLTRLEGSGPKGRILKEDLQHYVKNLAEGKTEAPDAAAGGGIPPVPEVDFARFGDIDMQPMSRLQKLTAGNMHRSWLNVPHVTQFDDVDITDLEAFRQDLKSEAEKREVKLTPLPFLLRACAAALRANPKVNASLHADGEHLVYKDYVHIGMAVDTPAGLVVPVMRDVDRKSVWELAAESAELAQRAKDRKLKAEEMQGGCFTISSLGGIGGTGFTPIINTPEVAILGVSKLAVKPQWNGETFEPRKMLPLSLSYDHRVINGADAGRFMTHLGELLADIRRLVL